MGNTSPPVPHRTEGNRIRCAGGVTQWGSDAAKNTGAVRAGPGKARAGPAVPVPERPRARRCGGHHTDGDVTAGGNKGRGTGRAAPALRLPPARSVGTGRDKAASPALRAGGKGEVRAAQRRSGGGGEAAAPGAARSGPGRAAPRPPPAAAGPRSPRPCCRPLPYLIWRRRLLIRLSPVSVASSVRLGLVQQRDVIRGGGLEAVPHLPGGSAAPPSPPPAPDPRPQPPRRSAQPAAAPPGRLMPAPALSGLAAAARPPPAPLRSRPDPRAGGAAGRASHPPWGSGLRWVRPRLPGAVLLPGHQLPAHWALSHGPPWLLLSPLPAWPGEQPRGLARLRTPRPRRGDSPARPRRDEAGRDGLGNPAACRAPPAPRWWEPLGPAPERGVCLCSGHGGAGGRPGPARRGGTGPQRRPPQHPARPG
ncbi:uncharacterized protein [Taeniopygia guttata]|uniref:uncharacterized protein n=1 Tax=Taeniopygia guttata TaxID=59729 RepID=UPI003BB920D0